MCSIMNVLAIIPARGGSKGVLRKNIRIVAGKPLIAHSIEQALQSKKITKVIVTTDDAEIKQIALKYGAEAIDRPAELASDTAPMLLVLKHAVERVQKNNFFPEAVVLLQPTNPLREVSHIDSALRMLTEGNYESVTTVHRLDINPSCLVKKDNIDKTNPYAQTQIYNCRQDINPIYVINGLVYAYKTEALMKLDLGSWCINNGALVVDSSYALDIDTEEELQKADRRLSRSEKEKIKSENYFNIKDKIVGENSPCLIIAEAGVNNNGSFDLAKKLVDAAVEAGADVIKFQTFKADLIVTKTTPKAEYQKHGEKDNESYYDLLKSLEMSEKNWRELKHYCDQKGIIFISTPHSGDWSVDLLEELGVPAYKIGSGDLTNLPFLDYTAKKGKPMIISTGMAVMEEIKEAVQTIRAAGNDRIAVLQCTTSYPLEIENVHLRAMDAIKKEVGTIVGFSDHTLGIESALAAVARGAKIIEKHFTIDKSLPGPDHKASATPEEFKKMVESIRKVEKALGKNEKKITATEQEISKIARKSIIAACDILQGVLITENMLIIKRPGIGILPKHLKRVIGRRAKENILKDTVVSWEMLE